MLERSSALACFNPVRGRGLSIGEARGFTLTQAAGFSTEFESEIAPITGALPIGATRAIASSGRTIFRTAPLQFWLVGPDDDDLTHRLAGKCVTTPLSHSRTRIFVEGKAARTVLAKGIVLDLRENAFQPEMFATTGLHHTPVLLHCVSLQRFELYTMRSFSVSVWEWLTDAALEFTA
jgi:heterotetrameric sarcosine oxidase gamma subunit